MSSRLVLLLLVLSTNVLLFAQSPSPDQGDSNQALMERIQQLETRLREMEERQRRQDAAMAALLNSQGTSEITAVVTTPPAPSNAGQTTERPGEHEHDHIRA